MQKKAYRKIRPLTDKMKSLLKECHERELNKEPPHSIYYTQSAKGLINRGLFYAKQYNGAIKPYMGFYLTQLGLDYLHDMPNSSAS